MLKSFVEWADTFLPFTRATVTRMPSLLHLHPPSRRDSKDPDVGADKGSQKAEVVNDEPDVDINAGELTFEEGTFVKPLSCCSSRT
jgi:hypothetical protein